MNTRWKRYLTDIGPAMLFYLASVIIAALLTKRIEPGAMRTLAAMLPLPSIVYLGYAELRRLRRRDELRQRIEIEAITIAFSVSFCLILMLCFLDLFGAFPVPVSVAAFLMTLCWAGAQLWVRMRYHFWA
ncbi:MAG: hypothetical protein R3F08_08060 [Dokdonella sp.]|nr:hypothetical protein [Dokdonella sp.]MCB1573225.1 hypothetical protein [Xanthomonadales bacterium]MCB1577592.1 hypothetical protein [Xanthomonadales bacterium]